MDLLSQPVSIVSGNVIIASSTLTQGNSPWYVSPSGYISVSPGQYILSLTPAKVLTIPTGATYAVVQAAVSSITYTTDGITTPTSTVGIILAAGASLPLSGANVLANFKAYSASGTISVEYFKNSTLIQDSSLNDGRGGLTVFDYSSNKPTLPNIGANFASSGPYSGYILISTVPASPSRIAIDVENISGSQIAILIDDGTASNGSAPANASVFSLGGGGTVGSQGGSWTSSSERGRIQVFAPSSSAIVSIRVN